jgi:hypothetical protein
MLWKNGVIYFWILNGKKSVIYKLKIAIENEKIIANNGLRNFIFLYNSKGEPCCITDISDNELDIEIY